MNYIDMFAVLILILSILIGYNQGLLKSIFNIANIILSVLIGLVFYGLVAKDIADNPQIIPTVVHFSEASEMLGGIENERISIYEKPLNEISILAESAKLPYPIDGLFLKNIEEQSFASKGMETLGDYLRQTIGCATINYVSFLIVFSISVAIFAVIISAADYVFEFPVLHSMDSVAGAIGGFIQGILVMNVIFLIIPLVLTFLPFEELVRFTDGSLFAKIYYYHNVLIKVLRGLI